MAAALGARGPCEALPGAGGAGPGQREAVSLHFCGFVTALSECFVSCLNGQVEVG